MPRGEQSRRRWSVPVARVGGITIRVHVTFLVLLGLVALSADAADESIVGETLWVLALFACVVAHELAHAAAARSFGIAVREIDLLPIGGMARLERIPEEWREETTIAAVGPLASATLAAALLASAAVTGSSLTPVTLTEGPALVRLGWANLVLAGFNLLPAFPMDGGRVLRAVLERGHDRVDATHRAAVIGRAIAVAMIAVGFVVDAWLMVIGWFVLLAGRAEETTVVVHAALEGILAGAAAEPCPVQLRADLPASVAAEVAYVTPQPAYPVVDAHGDYVGAVVLDDLDQAAPTTTVGELARGATADASVPLEELIPLVVTAPVAITVGGRVTGVVTAEVLQRHLDARRHRAVEHAS